MPSLVKIPELSQACREMAREMEKAGLIEEVIGDAMDAVDVRRSLSPAGLSAASPLAYPLV